MISIRECVSDVDLIRDEHVTFVNSYTERVIGFYLDVFKYLKKLEDTKGKGKTKIKINRDIKEIKNKNKSGDYKDLLKAFLNKGCALSKEDKAYQIKYRDNWIDSSINLTDVISRLENLKINSKKILEFNFDGNSLAIQRSYKLLQLFHTDISFLLGKIFDYDGWFSLLDNHKSWGPYQLTKKLNLNSCPYCNRQYTFTVINLKGGKVARPELDHFLPQSKHPLLALSFYNLIPSCHVCNSSVKGSADTKYETHLNPYEKNDKHSLMRFTYVPQTYEGAVGLTEEVDVELKYNGDSADTITKAKVEGNIDLFCLNDLYKNHSDNVQEIIRKREVSGDKYIEIMQKTFTDFPIKIEDAYRLAYGNYYLEKDFSRRALSKLTKDIAIELDTLIEYK